ncbi:MAG: helix-turn-helix transcriptional regulator [Saprospiraceae bacterium]|nr:helix-turn-helix transcriptional regulator [Saprospiraceae bacterium]
MLHENNRHVIKLSTREMEVLQLIVMEKTTIEMGNILFISPDTIKTHRKSIMMKLGANNMAGMVRKAYEEGFLSLG